MNTNDSATRDSSSCEGATRPKKPYVKPKLREYGSVTELTAGGSGGGVEGMSGMVGMN